MMSLWHYIAKTIMKVYVLTQSRYIEYYGDFLSIQGVALSKEAAQNWVDEQEKLHHNSYNCSHDFEEVDPIDSSLFTISEV